MQPAANKTDFVVATGYKPDNNEIAKTSAKQKSAEDKFKVTPSIKAVIASAALLAASNLSVASPAYTLQTGLGSIEEGFLLESELQKKLIGSPNQLEAIMSNLQKRAANYKD